MKKIINAIVVIFLIAVATVVTVFPEAFDTVARASLKRDIENGNKAAVEYYANRYERFGIDLFN